MATPTQAQPYSTGNPYPTAASHGGPPPSGYPADSRPSQSAQGHYGPPPQPTAHTFEKYCIIHIATTCDEHGVYVTKDSAEVIEIGWVVVDARDPNLPEVRNTLFNEAGIEFAVSAGCKAYSPLGE